MNHRQLQVIEYLREENRVLREQLGGRRVRLNDSQRRRLAVKAKMLGRKALAEVASIVTPGTLLAWHRKRIARSTTELPIVHQVGHVPLMRSRLWWCAWHKRTGTGAIDESRVRSPIMDTSLPAARSLRFCNDTGWSRKTPWKEFLSRHWEMIGATDFFTVEVWTWRGLQRFVVLFFIDLSTRKVEVAAIAQSANGLWMSQIARNLTDSEDGILSGKRYLIHDRDPLFTAEFLSVITGTGVESVKLPPRSPNLNAYAERFVGSIKESCLNRMTFIGEESLRTAIENFVASRTEKPTHPSRSRPP
jgi:hypothetical protein